GRILLASDLCGDECGRTHLACREVAADTGQHDLLSIGVFRGLHLPVRVLGHDLVRDPACGAEATNLLEVHVVQLLKEPRLLAFGELRQEVRHSRSLHAPALRRERSANFTIAACESVVLSSRAGQGEASIGPAVCCSQAHIGIGSTVPKSVPQCDPTLVQTCPTSTKSRTKEQA